MLVILSGPSGVGKDTVIEAWTKADPRIVRVVTYTTRPPREGEVDGRDYNFVDLDVFRMLEREGAFWESKNVHGHWYASPKTETEELIAEGRVPVLKIDVQGAGEVLRQRPDAVTVFLMPPSLEELERRIRGRGTDNDEAIQRRLANARGEMEQADKYQHRIVNDEVDEAVKRLMEVTK